MVVNLMKFEFLSGEQMITINMLMLNFGSIRDEQKSSFARIYSLKEKLNENLTKHQQIVAPL